MGSGQPRCSPIGETISYFTATSHVSTQQASRNPRRDEIHFPLPIVVDDSGGLTGMRDSVKGASGIIPIPTKRGGQDGTGDHHV